MSEKRLYCQTLGASLVPGSSRKLYLHLNPTQSDRKRLKKGCLTGSFGWFIAGYLWRPHRKAIKPHVVVTFGAERYGFGMATVTQIAVKEALALFLNAERDAGATTRETPVPPHGHLFKHVDSERERADVAVA